MVELDRRLRDGAVRAYSVHPGVVATALARYMTRDDFAKLNDFGSTPESENPVDIRRDFLTPEQGAATQVWAAVSPDLAGVGALYLADCRVRDDVAPYAIDEQRAARLWALSESLGNEGRSAMRWVTYRSDDGDRVGVVPDESIYAVDAGTTLIDLVARGHDGLRAAGEEAVRRPSSVVRLDEVSLRAPIPTPAGGPGQPVLPRPHAQLSASARGRTGAQGHLVPDPGLLLRLPVNRFRPLRRRAEGSRRGMAGLRAGDRRGDRRRRQGPVGTRKPNRRSSATRSSTTGRRVTFRRWKANWASVRPRARTAASLWAPIW